VATVKLPQCKICKINNFRRLEDVLDTTLCGQVL
jgi:hypothetical protein